MASAASNPDHSAFLDTLKHYGDLARTALLDRIPVDEPYAHLYGPMREFIENSGKGLRPALLIATCKAFGGREEDAVPSAAVIELLHSAFLIHDDIEDVSDFRRGRPCLHHEIGVPLAINLGDAMQAMALRLLRDNLGPISPDTSVRVVAEFDHLLKESLEGQALELGMIRDNALDIRPKDYLRMTLKKTCWYSFIHPCRIGALIARPNDVADGRLKLDDFNEFGFFLGAAFQIQDDVLNLIGSQKKYGKEIGGDIYEGKRTLMLARLTALAEADERNKLKGLLSKPRASRSKEEINWVLNRMQAHDCIGYAKSSARDLLAAAQNAFEPLFGAARPEDRRFISDCMDYMISRDV
ncbi:MAG: polyprenyl synthetase family protein [Boseongicola sp.]